MARVAVGLLVSISSWPRKIMFTEEGPQRVFDVAEVTHDERS